MRQKNRIYTPFVYKFFVLYCFCHGIGAVGAAVFVFHNASFQKRIIELSVLTWVLLCCVTIVWVFVFFWKTGAQNITKIFRNLFLGWVVKMMLYGFFAGAVFFVYGTQGGQMMTIAVVISTLCTIFFSPFVVH